MDAHHLVETRANPKVQPFGPGDTVTVAWRTREGDRERIQNFQGVVIRVRRGGPASSFTVRRIAYGVGVERSFPLASPLLEGVEVVRQGDVRRARLYYLRGLTGRAARIKERARPRPPKGGRAPGQ
mgnify:CR=1 FL=1